MGKGVSILVISLHHRFILFIANNPANPDLFADDGFEAMQARAKEQKRFICLFDEDKKYIQRSGQ